MKLLVDWALYSAALAVAAELVKGFKVQGGLAGTLVVSALFGLFNWMLGWLLIWILAVLSLGLSLLFSVVAHTLVTAVVLKVTSAFTDKLEIKSFWSALIAAALMSVTVAILKEFL
ncbi:MAG TPA: phage holin family protein [Polyangiaceae bacterium]|nr:phage holin family protein [Polyangiaceae bacterium]